MPSSFFTSTSLVGPRPALWYKQKTALKALKSPNALGGYFVGTELKPSQQQQHYVLHIQWKRVQRGA